MADRILNAAKMVDAELPNLPKDYNKMCTKFIGFIKNRLMDEGVIRTDIIKGRKVKYLQFPESHYGKIYDLNNRNGSNCYQKVYGVFKYLDNDEVMLHADYYDDPLEFKELTTTQQELRDLLVEGGEALSLDFFICGMFEIGGFSIRELVSIMNILSDRDMSSQLAPENIDLRITFDGFMTRYFATREKK